MDLTHDFSETQRRELSNLRSLYEAWRDAKLGGVAVDYRLNWQRRGEREYLYKRRGKEGNGESLGPRSPDLEKVYDDFQLKKAQGRERQDETQAALEERLRMLGSLGLALFPAAGARILRAADLAGVLGTRYLVVGTNAMIAYELACGHRFAFGLESTEDFDLAYTAGRTSFTTQHAAADGPALFELMKKIDSTYTRSSERTFQARNAKGYEVELLAAPSVGEMPSSEVLQPLPLPEQEWLLLGEPLFAVACATDRSPAPIVAPDPRWMALHKIWLAEKPQRDRLKVDKDHAQGVALLSAVREWMPHLDVGPKFREGLPAELAPHYDAWAAQSSPRERASWADE